MPTGTRRGEPAQHRSGPVHIDGEDYGAEHRTEGDNDGSRAADNLLYRGHRRPGGPDGQEEVRAARERLRPAEIEPYPQDDMSRFRK